MIVKMRKISLVLVESEKDQALTRLQKLGVLHLQAQKNATSEGSITALNQQKKRLDRALSLLREGEAKKQTKNTPPSPTQKKFSEIPALLDHLFGLREGIKSCEEELREIAREERRIEPLGEFDPTEIELLRSKQINFHLCEVGLKERWDPPFPIFWVGKTRHSKLCAVILPEGEMPEDYPEFSVPSKGLAELARRRAYLEEERDRLWEKLAAFSSEKRRLEENRLGVEDRISYQEVRTALPQEGPLVYLTGYAPAEKIALLRENAAEQSWGLLIQAPERGDPVPTLLRNNCFFRIIAPVAEMMGILPGYREHDISTSFLLFLGFFFALIIGDAGYATLLFLATVFLHYKKKCSGTLAALLYFLLTNAIVWGALTGSWFGSVALAKLEPLRVLTVPALAVHGDLLFGQDPAVSQARLMFLCFVVGVIHLGLAHLLKLIVTFPSWQFIAQLGALVTLFGCYRLVNYLVLGADLAPVRALMLVLVGLACLLIFGQQEKGTSFIQGVLRGLSGFFGLFLDGIGFFSDIMSYIRLFAVGLASSAIAESFNIMANPFWKEGSTIFFGVIILILGHGLNILLGGLSVIVHGVRLNLLEFSRHLGMEWTGVRYDPFRRHQLSSRTNT